MADIDLQDTETHEKRLGGSGIVLSGARLFNTQDYNPTLQGQSAMRVYDEMMRSDPEIAAILARILWALTAAKWSIVPVDDSDEEKEIAEFCERWVMGKGRTDHFAPKWADILRHALLCVPFGFSAFEKVWGTDEEGNQVYWRLCGILPKSVSEFVLKTDGSGDLDYLVQRVAVPGKGYVTAEIPAEKLAIVIFGREADNYWGTPLLRAMYKPWYWKDKLWRIDGMRHERHGLGFMLGKIPDGSTQAQKEAMEDLCAEVRAAERSFGVIEESFGLDILYPSGQGTDVVSSIKYYDAQMAQVGGVEFIHLGASESGSRAVSTSKMDLFLAGLQSVGDLVEDMGNQLCAQLVARNRGPRDAYPRVECDDLSKLSGTEMAETLSKLLSGGAITPEPELEQHLREVFQLPPIPEDVLEKLKQKHDAKLDQEIEMAKQPPMAAPFGGGEVPPQGGKPQPKPALKAASERVRTAREPLPHERFCAFSDMTKYLDEEPKRIWAVAGLPKLREDVVRLLAREVSEMTDSALRAANPPRPLQTKIAGDLYGPLLKVYRRGRRALLTEKARQLSGEPAEPLRMAEEEEDDIEPTKPQESWVRSLAGKFAGLFVGAMALEAVRLSWNSRNAQPNNMTKEEASAAKAAERRAIEDGLRSLSLARQQQALSGVVTQAFTNGRNEQADSMRGEIGTAFYSALMDPATCDNCAPFDGIEHEPGDDTYATPNPNCLGGDNCRCVTVYVFRREEVAA